LKSLFSIFHSTVIGFLFLAGFLWVLSEFYPSVYRGVTKWENQPNLPEFKSCLIKDNSDKDAILREIPDTKNYKRYLVQFKIENRNAKKGSYIIHAKNDPLIGLVKSTQSFSDLSNNNYIVQINVSLMKVAEAAMYVDTIRKTIEIKEYLSEDCPISLSFFGD